MTNIERNAPQDTEPTLRGDPLVSGMYSFFESFKEAYPYFRIDDESNTIEWTDAIHDIDLRLQREDAWTGRGQTLTFNLTLHQVRKRLTVDRFNGVDGGGPLPTTERIRVNEAYDGNRSTSRDATDADLIEFETICAFAETDLRTKARKDKLRYHLNRTVRLSERFGRELEVDEETYFSAQEF